MCICFWNLKSILANKARKLQSLNRCLVIYWENYIKWYRQDPKFRAQLFKANDVVSYTFVKIYIEWYANMLKFFAEKNVCSFPVQKLLSFSAKNIRILYIESAKTVNEITLNELVKLTTLWITGPRALSTWPYRLFLPLFLWLKDSVQSSMAALNSFVTSKWGALGLWKSSKPRGDNTLFIVWFQSPPMLNKYWHGGKVLTMSPNDGNSEVTLKITALLKSSNFSRKISMSSFLLIWLETDFIIQSLLLSPATVSKVSKLLHSGE